MNTTSEFDKLHDFVGHQDKIEIAKYSWNHALEVACKIVFGHCESDNLAQLTVNEIRKLKVISD